MFITVMLVKLGIVVYSNEAETVFNAFRLGIFSAQKNDSVKIFLLAKGVESETLDTDKFIVSDAMKKFVDSGGKILACGTCLKIRQSEGSEICPLSTLADLYQIIDESDKVISF